MTSVAAIGGATPEEAPIRKLPLFKGAEARGYQAGLNGALWTDCPYKIAPKGCNRRNGGTWGAVWRHAWLKGWFRGKKVRWGMEKP